MLSWFLGGGGGEGEEEQHREEEANNNNNDSRREAMEQVLLRSRINPILPRPGGGTAHFEATPEHVYRGGCSQQTEYQAALKATLRRQEAERTRVLLLDGAEELARRRAHNAAMIASVARRSHPLMFEETMLQCQPPGAPLPVLKEEEDEEEQKMVKETKESRKRPRINREEKTKSD